MCRVCIGFVWRSSDSKTYVSRLLFRNCSFDGGEGKNDQELNSASSNMRALNRAKIHCRTTILMVLYYVGLCTTNFQRLKQGQRHRIPPITSTQCFCCSSTPTQGLKALSVPDSVLHVRRELEGWTPQRTPSTPLDGLWGARRAAPQKSSSW